jgi:uncharacterized protein (TIGR02145 family)
MKNRHSLSIFPLLIMDVFLVFAISCEKDEDNSNPYGTMTDQDGNTYKTITIGTQTWMAENLRTTKYNDGTTIPNLTDDDEWAGLSTGAYCNYNNTNNTDTIATYGRLYNWYAVNTGKLAPNGWHVPTDAEWTQLTTFLGGESIAGDKLKETGTSHWVNPNTGATNETGFTALPGGARDGYGSFFLFGYSGFCWSATDCDGTSAWSREMSYDRSNVLMLTGVNEVGFSVRCVRN